MLDTNTLTKSDQTTQVVPSDNIFTELGKNTYDYKDLLSELVDNAIAARRPNCQLEVRVSLYVDADNRPVDFVIEDNASGIARDRLGDAITPAGVQCPSSLNEHGLGMKQAVAALGCLKYLATKTAEDTEATVVLSATLSTWVRRGTL